MSETILIARPEVFISIVIMVIIASIIFLVFGKNKEDAAIASAKNLKVLQC